MEFVHCKSDGRLSGHKKKPARAGLNWLRGQDLNLGPSGYEPDELPGCSTPRLGISNMSNTRSQRKKFRPKSRMAEWPWCILIFERLCKNISLAPGFRRVTVKKKEKLA